MEKYPITSKNKVKRIPKRGFYDKESLYKVLDAGFVCHIGFEMEGQAYVIPTSYGRVNNSIYVHGATTSRMLQHVKKGAAICLTVTHIDGLVLARSAFHHSINYRSAVVFGTATEVDITEKTQALKAISDHILRGRWEESRLPNAKELKATSVLKVEIDQASVKIRSEPPKDEKEDYALPIWSGEIPIHQKYGVPKPDPLLTQGIPLPDSLGNLPK